MPNVEAVDTPAELVQGLVQSAQALARRGSLVRGEVLDLAQDLFRILLEDFRFGSRGRPDYRGSQA